MPAVCHIDRKNEEARLEVLSKYRILDTPRERDFDDLVRLAAQICQTPVSLVSLVDRNRQWFKGRYGLDISETPRSLSFCSHTIQNAPETMVVKDATQDERFRNNELVTGSLNLRFYAGAPLVTPEGQALGTLCVIDTRPRTLTVEQQEALQILSRQVMAQLELRRRLAELERASSELSAAHERETSRHAAIEREQARELHQSEERFRAIFDHAGLGIGELDSEGRFLMVNDRWCEIVKRDRSALLGMSVLDLTHPDDRETTLRRNQQLVRGEVPWISYDKRLLCAEDGSYVWVRVTITAIRCDSGEFLRGIAMVEDITERKQFQAELERCVTERTTSLREALSGLEAFSYSLSHDMRAPLRAIKGYTSIVLDRSSQELGPDGRSGLEKVLNATHRLDQLITDVLAFSRVSREEVQLRPVDLESLLNGIIQERPEFMAPRALITIEGTLPVVIGHEVFLTQCLTNLLGNAVKFVAPGVTPSVRIHSERDGDWVRIVIHDNGIGFPSAARDRIFNIFQRLHANTAYEGTGLGLAIVKRAVERMGGTVGVESEPGQGSRFWLRLRAATQPNGEAQIPGGSRYS